MESKEAYGFVVLAVVSELVRVNQLDGLTMTEDAKTKVWEHARAVVESAKQFSRTD